VIATLATPSLILFARHQSQQQPIRRREHDGLVLYTTFTTTLSSASEKRTFTFLVHIRSNSPGRTVSAESSLSRHSRSDSRSVYRATEPSFDKSRQADVQANDETAHIQRRRV